MDFAKGGDASLCELIEEYGDIDTARVQTGAGLHFYFQHPGVEIRNSAGRLGDGLDIRGDGGFVIGAASMHPNGKRYEWQKATPVAPMPGWLLERLTTERQTTQGASVQKTQPHEHSSLLTGAFIPEGDRNNTLFKIACSVRGQGGELPAILSAITIARDVRCEAGSERVADDELLKIAHSAMRYPPNPASRAASQ